MPLTQDFVKEIYTDIFSKLCLRLTNNQTLIKEMQPYLDNMIAVPNWRIYYNISNWYVVLKLLPFSNAIIPMWQKMMGVANQDFSSHKMKVPMKTKLNVCKTFFKYLKTTPNEMNILCETFLNKLPEYEQKISDANTISELLLVYNQIKTEILSNWDITLVNMISGASMNQKMKVYLSLMHPFMEIQQRLQRNWQRCWKKKVQNV